MAQILVIDDEVAFRESLIETLTDLGHQGIGTASVTAGLEILETKRIDLIFIDFRMPEMNGIEGIKLIRAQTKSHPVPVVMLTAHVTSENTIEAMKLGAFDHLNKPLGRKDIERVVGEILKANPASNHRGLQKRDVPKSDSLVGESPLIRDVLKMIGKLSASDSSVLITGETGTGKELVARAIHTNSERAKSPFIAINCAAIPENLLESELFGHVKGAFTGATSDRIGSFQQAGNGTLFLDEIGDMSFALQSKLLRALQEKEVMPVGANRPSKINARFLAATHQNLSEMVRLHKFREDLYYRLNVVELHLPALRDREIDIPLLVHHFLESTLAELKEPTTKKFTSAALSKLSAHSWPGNVRELKNTVERAVVISRGSSIDESDIRFIASAAVESQEASDQLQSDEDLDLPSSVAALEQRLILRALKVANGNRSEAARKLGIQRQLLYTKLKEYRIDHTTLEP